MQKALQEAKDKQRKVQVNINETKLVKEDKINIEEWYCANMENWYSAVSQYTFATEFITLTEKDGDTIIAAYDKYISNSKLSEDQIKLLEDLGNKIDIAVKKSEASFVKLSCRSPKDVTATSKETIEYYRVLIKEQKDRGGIVDDNFKIISLFQAHLSMLRVTSGKQALDLLIKSARIYDDIKLELEDLKERDDHQFKIQVIVRQFIPVLIKYEFRGFVYTKKLVALSQYFDVCYFPELTLHKDLILKNIFDLFEVVRDRIALQNYIIDFCLIDFKPYIIELNPYLPTTDSCLFSWSRDAKILQDGPFEFRFNNKVVPHISQKVISVWQPYLLEN